MHTRTQEKGAVNPQETDPNLPVSFKESLAEAWVGGALLLGREHWVWQCVHGTFEGGCHYLHYLYHSLVSGQTTGREHNSTKSADNWIKDLLKIAPPIRTRPNFPHSQFLPSGSFHSLLSLSFRGQTEWKPHRKAKWNGDAKVCISALLKSLG